MMRFTITFITAVTILAGCGPSSDTTDKSATADRSSEKETVELLFVLDAKGIEYDGETLMMKEADPYLLYFSDRPERIAGHLTIDAFLEEVSKGTDSFADDPPNATLVVFGRDELLQVVLELPTKPQYRDGNLLFKVRVIEGAVPESGGESTLFIDTVGHPLSPGSVAGVHRRDRRRHERHRR